MAITLTFPNAADSPNGRTDIRLRYALQPGGGTPVLHFGKGKRTVTREAWLGYRELGASLSWDDAREHGILLEVLGEL